MSKRAEKELMEGLHQELAKTLSKFVAKKYYDSETGEEIPPPAAILNVARQFLKDNGIEGNPVEGTPLDFLKHALPFGELKESADSMKLN